MPCSTFLRATRGPLLALAILAPAAGAGAAQVKVSHLYHLSDFSGTIPYGSVRLFVDRPHDEVYAADGNTVRVFNGAGMEIFEFAYDAASVAVRDIAVDEEGRILLLAYDFSAPSTARRWSIVRCDFRGEPEGRIDVSGIEAGFAGIEPNRLFRRGAKLLLVSERQMLAIETDQAGAFERGFDLATLAGVEEEDRASTEIFGSSLGPDGQLLFTVPTMFKAFVVAADGQVAYFGRPGGGPGKFGVASGIAMDDRGNYLVTDRLRCVVMVFDPSFRYVKEFGYRGEAVENLIAPSEPVMGNDGRLYVTQMRKRGVPVYSVTVE